MTQRSLIAFCMAACVALTACSGDNAGSDSSAAALRARYGATQPAQVDAQPATDQPAPTLTPTAQISATETPDMQPQSIAAPVATVEALPTIAQPAQVVEVTPTAAVIVTPTPQPVQIVAGIDESMQPCPARFWKRGRCTATQAQIDAAASEVQP